MMSLRFTGIIIPLALIGLTGVSCAQPTTTTLETSCPVVYQTLSVTLLTPQNTTTQFTSDDLIQASVGDSLQFTIPSSTFSVLSELYFNPAATEAEEIDRELNMFSGWEAEKLYTITLPELPPGSIMRYFFCPKKDNDSTTEGCYPGCYTSRLLVQIKE